MGIDGISKALGETASGSYLHSVISETGFEIPVSAH